MEHAPTIGALCGGRLAKANVRGYATDPLGGSRGSNGSTLEIGTFYVNDTHGNPVRSFYALATESVGLLPRTTAVKYAG